MNNIQKAIKYGIDYKGLTKEVLAEEVKKKEAEISSQNITPPENTDITTPVTPNEPTKPIEPATPTPPEEKKDKKEKDVNVAIVKNGKFEVRRFNIEDHGKKFADLAQAFANKNNYQVELIKQEKIGENDVEKETDVAIVKKGKYEIRRYSLKENGKKYLELAKEFSDKNGYQIEIIEPEK